MRSHRINLFLIAAAAALPAGAQSDSRILRTAEYRSLQRDLCRGWNTWSANSVMAHVHLPDGFALTLGIKTAGMGRTYQNSFFQANQTAGRPEKVRLGPHSDDGSYTDLTMEYPANGNQNAKNVMRVESAEQDGEEYILVTVGQTPWSAREPLVRSALEESAPNTPVKADQGAAAELCVRRT